MNRRRFLGMLAAAAVSAPAIAEFAAAPAPELAPIVLRGTASLDEAMVAIFPLVGMMAFSEMLEHMRTDICAAFAVPPELIQTAADYQAKIDHANVVNREEILRFPSVEPVRE